MAGTRSNGEEGRSLLSARCRELRRERLALTQREWAAKLGVTPITVARWELGRGGPSLPMIRRMADIAHLPIAWFFGAAPESNGET